MANVKSAENQTAVAAPDQTTDTPLVDDAIYRACATVISAERSIERTAVTRPDVEEFWASVCEARRLRAASRQAP